jgi:gamma-glutamylcyclotransferase (GGCT)/AIG2-like uncharacterized protein YtfP
MECSNLFVYGILKRGKSADLSKFGAKFIGEAKLEGAQLYHVRHGVGLRIIDPPVSDIQIEDNLPIAVGEVWEIPDPLWEWLDRIESNGYVYTRKIVTPEVHDANEKNGFALVDAWTYEHTYPGHKYNFPVEGNDWKGNY